MEKEFVDGFLPMQITFYSLEKKVLILWCTLFPSGYLIFINTNNAVLFQVTKQSNRKVRGDA